MPRNRPIRRFALLTESGLEMYRNKTAMGLLRYCPQDVLCVIDPAFAGKNLEETIGMGGGIPVVASVEEAAEMRPDYLVIGIAPAGGYLPDDVREEIYKAIRLRIGIISGLHQGLRTDPNIASLSCRHAVELVDLRKVSQEDEHYLSTAKARETHAVRALTVGTDCNIGKMTTALQIEKWLRQRKYRARFVATGQNGILIKGRGVTIDHVIADFAAGAVERLVLREAHNMDMVLIEGQGSLYSPPYSGVSMSLLHGSCPDAMILCHRAGRVFHRNGNDVPIPPIENFVQMHEDMLSPLHPGKVVAVSVNTFGMSEEDAMAELEDVRQRTGLPTADVVREGDAGCERIAQALLDHAAIIEKPLAKDALGHTSKAMAFVGKHAREMAQQATPPAADEE